MSQVNRSVAAEFEGLEARLLLAFNPSGREQELLELINRMRQFPAAELSLLTNSNDSDVNNAISQFHVNKTELAQQWKLLVTAQPLAWNESLYKSAVGHSQKMLQGDVQSHQVTGELDLRGRASAQGYTAQSFLGENVFAYAKSMFQAHAGFAIDWGNTSTGIQTPAGHRSNIMASSFREIGIGVIDTTAGKSVGPLLVTQDFGGPVGTGAGNPFILGTIRKEKNNDKLYNAGEGLGGVQITITGTGSTTGTFNTTTLSAGGYQLQVPAGTYTVSATGGGLGTSLLTIPNVAVAAQNVKRDFVQGADVVAPVAQLSASALSTAGSTPYTFQVTYADNTTTAFTGGNGVKASLVGTGDVKVTGPHAFSQVATLVSKTPASGNPRSIVATYQVTAPGGAWDLADNGKYTVTMVAAQVKDAANNAVAAGKLGTFNVSVPAAGAAPTAAAMRVAPSAAQADDALAGLAPNVAGLFACDAPILA